MIDLWILRIIFSRGLLMKSIVSKKIDNIWITVNKIRNYKKLGSIIHKSFGLDNYIGQHYDEIIFFKNKIRESYIPEYSPYDWKRTHPSYKTF